MHPTETPLIKRPIVCKLCGHQFKTRSLAAAAILGNNPQAKLKQIAALIQQPMEHIAKHHGEQLQFCQQVASELAGMLTLNLIQCDEPAIEEQRDSTRWRIFQMMRRVKISDERIKERLALAFMNTALTEAGEPIIKHATDAPATLMATAVEWIEAPLAKAILQTVIDMRDVMEERGRYPMPTMYTQEKNGTPQPPTNTPAA